MKKLLCVFSLLLVVGFGYGQIDAKEAKKELKAANRSFNLYNLDQQGKISELDNAMIAIEKAIQNSEISAEVKTWILRGDIYNAISSRDETQPVVDPTWKNSGINGGLISFESYKKVLELAEKKFEKQEAFDGFRTSVSNLNSAGMTAYRVQDYTTAYNSFSPIMDIHEILISNGQESPLATEDDVNNQSYIIGLSALNSKNNDKAKELFGMLVEKNVAQQGVYEGLHKIAMEENNMDEAENILSKGRAAFPDDLGLMFSEINHYLKLNKTDVLVGKLSEAIELQEASGEKNVSLYATRGNVYDKLYQDLVASGEKEQAVEYFDKAKLDYELALEIKEDYVEALYSLGALYFNKAAGLTVELTKLATDYSKEGTKKYKAKELEVSAEFEHALPYFKRAEILNPNDQNTLTALKEIYARKNNFEISNAFKERLETVKSGGVNDTSYFKNN